MDGELRAAAVDIGTNSVRLLVAEVGWEADTYRLRTLHRRMTITRLGQGVDRQGLLDREAVSRTLGVLREYRDIMRREGVEAWEVAATSAARDAANSGEFVGLVREVMDKKPRVLCGEEEALLSFVGATYDLGALRPGDHPILVADIGGGSTEMVLGTDREIVSTYSLDVGCVRMSERFLHSDPPARSELEEMEMHIGSVVSSPCAELSRHSPGLLVGTAGTVTTLSGLKLGLERYDGEAIHHSRLSRREVEALYGELSRLPIAERRRRMRLEPGRADVIVGGTAVLVVLLREMAWERLLVSEKDILDGLAIRAAETTLDGR